jgi:deoxycytidine triphosphate deaminase
MNKYSDWIFAETEKDARERFEKFESLDPLPATPEALLNAGDIYHYIRITSMVWPFDFHKERLNKKLKPASYEIDFLGEVHETDNTGRYKTTPIKPGTPFCLEKNKIVFVFLETQFFLPNYIAIRFNLRINLVHRGLLLGTGPLVDPGFAGRLLIPLHNLTSKDYMLFGGEGLIWVEFTKLSGQKHLPEHSGAFETAKVQFPSAKRWLNAQHYFNEASNGIPAVSSIPGEVKAASDTANEAKATVEKIKNWAIGAGLALAASIAGLVFASWDLISSANKNISDASNTVADIRADQAPLLERISTLERELAVLRRSPEKSSTVETITKQDSP